MASTIANLRAIYCQAERCWRVNNFRSCLQICDQLSRALKSDSPSIDVSSSEIIQLINLVWFLKIKCLSEDHFVDESLLLNEDDVESDDQIKTFLPTTRQAPGTGRNPTAQGGTSRPPGETERRKMTMATSRVNTSRGRPRTGMLTGRMPTGSSSRQSGRATSSYRPLTTSLTATQTAFSRSTKPLLRYSTSCYLSKPIYEYLYNTQKVNSKCPDYRQCLEYLNLVTANLRGLSADSSYKGNPARQTNRRSSEGQLITINDDSSSGGQNSDQFWHLSHAVCYYNLRMHKLAEDHLQLALKINSKLLNPYLWLIKIYLRLNQPMKVFKTCEDGLANCRSAILYNWKARVQSIMNQNYAAHLSLKQSIQYYPTNIEALANIGYYSFYDDKSELSLKCFERIYQLTSSRTILHGDGAIVSDCGEASLLNNLALAYFYCGHYAKVMPLFQAAFLCSPDREVTSDIWFNISFVPLSLGSRPLAMACLKLALRNNSQNEDALNNLGVLKYNHLIDDPLHYGNRQEYWSESLPTRSNIGLTNRTDQRRQQALYDDAETFFSSQHSSESPESSGDDSRGLGNSAMSGSPVILFNMAVIKRKRGQLLASSRFCRSYLESDPYNHMIRNILNEIREFVAHDS